MTDASPKEKTAELWKRPDIDAVVRQYEQIRTEIRERLVAEVELPDKWKPSREETDRLCGDPYSDVADAYKVFMANWVNDTAIPENKWSRAQEVFTKVTGQHGFGPLQVVVDAPNDHLLRTYDAYGAEMSFGMKKATVLSTDTGCHLAKAAHPGTTTDAPA